MRSPRLLAVAAFALAAACSTVPVGELTRSGEDPGPATTAPRETHRPGRAGEAPSPVPGPDPATLTDLPGLLAIVDDAGLALTTPGGVAHGRVGDDRVGGQPTWSRDGTRLAASFVAPFGTGDDGDLPHALVLVDTPEGPTGAPLDALRVDTAVAWFFASWSPDGSRLAVLGPGDDATVLGLLDAGGAPVGPGAELGGSPQWVAWSPDSSRLAVRSSGELRTVDRDGTVSPVIGPAGFVDPTPLWLDDTRVLAYVGTDPTRVSLQTIDVDTGEVGPLGDLVVDHPRAVSLDPTRRLLALVHRGEATTTAPIVHRGEATTTAPIAHHRDPTVGAAASRVEIVEVATGARRTVADVPVVWLEWSPDGDHLLIGVPGSRGVRWDVAHVDGTVAEGPTLRPSGTEARDHLPFFEQYVESPRRWSPDSRAFVVSGRYGTVDGVWVIPLTDRSRPLPTGVRPATAPSPAIPAVPTATGHEVPGEPVWVADGRVAFWSPRAPGS